MDEELKKQFEKLTEIIETLPPQLKKEAEAVVNSITTLLADLGHAMVGDVWSGRTFSSSNGIRLVGTLSVAPDQIRYGDAVHEVVGTAPIPAPVFPG